MSRRWGHSQQTTPAYLRLVPFVFWGKRMILIKSISIIDRVEPACAAVIRGTDSAFAGGLDTEGDCPGPLANTAGRDTHAARP
jgi:hypothetical protein